jgi:hypothetical protein
MTEQRTPRPGETWHRTNDPNDIAMIYEVRGEHPTVYWTSPANAEHGRPVAKTWATRINDFMHDFLPPQGASASGPQSTPIDLSTGMRGEYNEWVIETKLGRRLAVYVDRSPYPEDARRQLEALRAAHPGMVFRAVRETTTRTEEDW